MHPDKVRALIALRANFRESPVSPVRDQGRVLREKEKDKKKEVR